MPNKRVTAFIDGFNLYHALRALGKNHLKWLDLWSLAARYINPSQKLTSVKYFSAYATWLPESYSRHRAYVKALQYRGVDFIEGRFKEKQRGCHRCKARWIGHEEKETDVNIAIRIVADAYEDRFDHAILISADSDLAPAIKLVKSKFSQKLIFVGTPPKLMPSKDLIFAAGGYQFSREIRESHVVTSLFPMVVNHPTLNLSVVRPTEYDPHQ